MLWTLDALRGEILWVSSPCWWTSLDTSPLESIQFFWIILLLSCSSDTGFSFVKESLFILIFHITNVLFYFIFCMTIVLPGWNVIFQFAWGHYIGGRYYEEGCITMAEQGGQDDHCHSLGRHCIHFGITCIWTILWFWRNQIWRWKQHQSSTLIGHAQARRLVAQKRLEVFSLFKLMVSGKYCYSIFKS